MNQQIGSGVSGHVSGGAGIPVRKGAGGRGLLARRLLLGGAALAMCAPAWAGPEGEFVARGSALFTRVGPLTTITAGNNAIINYRSFNIASGETVRFIQPSATSRVLNRIQGADPTVIAGTIIANGIVYIVNPAGVYFRQGALVDVGGIYAGAAHISDGDFARGSNYFSQITGEVRNEGAIHARNIALIGQSVVNAGELSAPGGSVVMTAGDNVYIGERNGTIFARVSGDPSSTAMRRQDVAAVQNTGTINAEGGRVSIITGDLYALAARNTGSVRARDISINGGRGVVDVGGTLDASAGPNDRSGGTVRITGSQVNIREANINASGPQRGGVIEIGGGFQGRGPTRHADQTIVGPGSVINADATAAGGVGGTVSIYSTGYTGFYGVATARGGEGGRGGAVETSGLVALDIRDAMVSASARNGRNGLWLLDPRDVTIDNGGTFSNPFNPAPGNTVVNVTSLTNALAAGTNVTITTFDVSGSNLGNITLNQPITPNMTGAATLTLRAANNINLGQAITASGAGALSLVLSANDQTLGDDSNTAIGVVNITAPITTNNGSITISNGSGTISGVTTSAALNLGAGALSVISNGAVSVGGAVTAGSVSVQGGSISLNAGTVNTASGTQGYTGPVTLASNTTLTATSVSFSSTVDAASAGAQSLTVNGGVTFGGNVGNTLALRSLAVTGAAQLNAAIVRTSNAAGGNANQTFGGAITLGVPNDQVVNLITTGGTVTFNGTVDGTTAGRQGMTITGNGVVNASVGGTVPLGLFGISLLSTLNTPLITTQQAGLSTGQQLYTGTCTLAQDVTLTAIGSTVGFGGFVNATTAGGQSLTVNGNATFADNVGQAVALRSLTVTGLATIFDNVNTTNAGGGSGNQTYGSIRINTLANTDLTLTATGGTVTVGAVDAFTAGAQGLVVTGNAAFNGAIGQNFALRRLSVSGTTALNAPTVATTNAAGGPGTQTYTGGVTLGADTALTATGGSITFSSTVNGNQILDITGNTVFNGVIGGTTPLNAITVNGTTNVGSSGVSTQNNQTYNGAVVLAAPSGTTTTFTGNTVSFISTLNALAAGAQGLAVSGAAFFGSGVGSTVALRGITVTGDATLTAGNTYTTTASGGGNGAQIYGGSTTLAGTAGQTVTINSGAGNVIFTAIDSAGGGGRGLAINSTGITTLGGAIGSINTLSSLSTNAGGSTRIGSGTIGVSGGTIFNDAVVLTADTTIADPTGVTFASTVNSDATARALTVNSAGNTVFGGAVGGTSALDSLTTDAGGTVSFAGNVTSTNAQSYGENATLAGTAGSTTVFTGSTVGFGGTLNATTAGAQSARIAGDGTFSGDIGGTRALGALTVTGTASLPANITTTNAAGGTGNQTYSQAVVLTQDTVFNATGGTVAFGSTVDATSSGGQSLTVNGGGSFGGAVGGTTPLSLVLVTGVAALNGGAVTTTLTQSYGDGSTLGANTTLTGTLVTFTGDLDGAAAGQQSLAIVGNADFQGGVGSGVALSSLSVTGTTGIGGDVETSGTQLYVGDVTLNGAAVTRQFTGSSITFGGALDAATAGGQGAAFVGDAVFGTSVGATAALRSLSVSGTASLPASVSTTNAGGGTGNQTYSQDVTLAQNTTLTATGGTVSFNGALDGAGFGTESLTISGDASFNGDVGSTNALASISVSGATAMNAATVNTTGNQVYSGAMTLNATGGNTVLNAGAGDITLNAVDGTTGNPVSFTLNSSGVTNLNGAIGASVAIGSLRTDGGGTTMLCAPTINVAQDIVFGDNVVLTVDTVLTAGNLVTYSGTVDSDAAARALTVNTTGVTTFTGDVGATAALSSLTTDAGGSTVIGGAAVTTTGDQNFGDAVTLSNVSTNFTSSTGTVAFLSTVDGTAASTQALTVTGNARFDGVVGGTTILDTLTVTGTTALNNATINTNDIQTYQGAVFLGGTPGTISTLTSVNDSVRFNSTIDSAADAQGGRGLVANAAGLVSFGGAIGATTPLSSLTTGATGLTSLSSGTVSTIGPISFGNGVQLGATTTLNSGGGDITFGSSLSGSFNLTVDAGAGATTFAGPVGSVGTPFGTATGPAITLDSVGPTTFGGAVILANGILATGDVTFAEDATFNLGDTGSVFNGNVTIDGATLTFNNTVTFGDSNADSVLLTGAASSILAPTSNITVNSKIDGGQALTISSGTGTLVLAAAVGSVTPLSSLNLTGSVINLGAGSIAATGDVIFNSPLTLTSDNNVTTTTGNVNFASTINGGFGLSVNSGTGTTTFSSAIGGTTPLTSLSTAGTGTTNLNSGTVTTAGPINFGNNVLLGATTTLTSGNGAVTFGAALDGAFNLLVASGTGFTTFTGPVGGTTRLGSGTGRAIDVTGTGDTFFNGGLRTNSGVHTAGNATLAGTVSLGDGDTATNFDGNVTLDGATITSADSLTFGNASSDTITLTTGPVSVRTTNTSAGLTFSGPVDGAQQLTATTANSATSPLVFGASVGATTPLIRFITSVTDLAGIVGTCQINGNITTVNGVTIGHNLVLNNNSVISANNAFPAVGNGQLLFRGTINSAAANTPRSLTLLTGASRNTPVANLGVSDANNVANRNYVIPILFGGNIGTTARLSGLNINFNPTGSADRLPSGVVPTLSTIVFASRIDADGFVLQSDITSAVLDATTFNVNISANGNFVQGFNEKILAFGTLNINLASGTGRARIGDITTLRGLNVNAPNIEVRSREIGFIAGYNNSGQGIFGQDAGADYVAGTTIAFNGTVTVSNQAGTGPGGTRPSFATPDGAGITGVSGFTQRAFGGGDLRTQFVDRAGPGGIAASNRFIALDLQSKGPTNQNISETIAAFTNVDVPPLPQTTGISGALIDQLREIAIYVQPLEAEQLVEFLVGRDLYNDTLRSSQVSESDRRVSAARLSYDIVVRVLDQYRGIKENADTYKTAFADVYTAYAATLGAGGEFSAAGFAEFIRQDSSKAGEGAREACERLGKLFRSVDQLGLGPVETGQCKKAIVAAMLPADLTADQLVGTINVYNPKQMPPANALLSLR